jgi:hypothetical protein
MLPIIIQSSIISKLIYKSISTYIDISEIFYWSVYTFQLQQFRY